MHVDIGHYKLLKHNTHDSVVPFAGAPTRESLLDPSDSVHKRRRVSHDETQRDAHEPQKRTYCEEKVERFARESVVLAVVAKERREALGFLHQTRVHVVGRHAHDGALFPDQDEVFCRLLIHIHIHSV